MKNRINETKVCANCHRPFQNRKKWESRGIWDEVKYCSKRCRNEAKSTKSLGKT